MGIGEPRDPVKTAAALEGWLVGVLEASDVAVRDVSTPGATGYSNETLLFRAEWTDATGRHDRNLVGRVAPTSAGVFPAYDLALQRQMLTGMRGRPGIPVPEVLWWEDDDTVLGAPFYVMERIDGLVPTDNPPYTLGGWVLDASHDEQHTLYTSALDTMAAIHRLDWRDGFAFLEGRVPIGLDAYLSYYGDYFRWAAGERPQPVATAALDWITEHRPTGEQPLAICWGDARISNVIFRDYRPVAVLDWEMVSIGDPVMDLGWWLFLDRHFGEGIGVDNPPGFPSRDETVARWEQAVGRGADHLEFYETLAGFRFAVVMIRIARLLAADGQLDDDSDFDRNNIVTQLLAKMLGLPAPG